MYVTSLCLGRLEAVIRPDSSVCSWLPAKSRIRDHGYVRLPDGGTAWALYILIRSQFWLDFGLILRLVLSFFLLLCLCQKERLPCQPLVLRPCWGTSPSLCILTILDTRYTHTHTHWNIHTAHTVIIERIKYVFLLLGSPWKTVQAPVHRPTVTHHHRHYGGHGIGNGYVLIHWAFKRAVQDTIYPSYLIFLSEMAPIRFHVQVSVRHQRKKMVDRISCNIGNG